MAKFCQYCGTQLEDGQVCSCPQAQADAAQAQAEETPAQAAPEMQAEEPPVQAAPQGQAEEPPVQAAPQGQAEEPPVQAAPQAAGKPSPVRAAFQNLLPFCKAYLRSPVNATRTAIQQKDLILAILLLAIQVIAAGLMVFALLAKVCGTVEGIVLKAMGWGNLLSGSGYGLLGGISGPSISASFLLCLIFGILAAAISIVIFAALIFAVAKLMKSAFSFRDVIIACGANSPFVTVLLLLAFVLFFASFQVGLILFVLAMLTWVIMGALTAQIVTPSTEQGKFWMLYIAAVLVAVLVGGWVCMKFFGLSVNATRISYGGESVTIGQAVDAMGGLDLEDALEDIFYDFF